MKNLARRKISSLLSLFVSSGGLAMMIVAGQHDGLLRMTGSSDILYVVGVALFILGLGVIGTIIVSSD